MKQFKVVITGGHFTPAYALFKTLEKRGGKIYWIGHTQAARGVKSLEARVLPQTDIQFYPITTFKLQRTSALRSMLASWKLLFGFAQSLTLLIKIKPDVVLSFGSYVSVPVALSGFTLGVPIIVHEQTAASGLANRLVAKFAKAVAISFEESRKYFPQEKTVLTGNLVRANVFRVGKVRRGHKIAKPPVLYITGGSRGSQIINKTVFDALESLSANFKVIHQTGTLGLGAAKEAQKNLPENLRKNYEVRDVLTLPEVEEILKNADFAISRSGANTVSEFAVAGLPAIFIPLSYSESDEQTKNAMLLVNLKSALILPERELGRESLMFAVEKMNKSLPEFYKNTRLAQKLVPKGAAEKLVDLICDQKS